jgi:hypothetical protein
MDKSLNDIEVSFFKSISDKSPQPFPLLRWLSGSDKLNPIVDRIRATSDKATRDKLKRTLPAVTPSGLFTGGHRAENLVNHSGFIALDFDKLQDVHEAKRKISQIANVFYCGLSVSGGGLWALVPISNPEHHKQHFDALRIDFLRLGLMIDKACSDVCRLRFYSYDSDPVFNMDAVTYTKTFIQPPEPEYIPQGLRSTSGDPLSVARKMIHEATPGELHNTLLKAAYLLGGYIATGQLSEVDAVHTLEYSIKQKPIRSFEAAKKTIQKGIKAGKSDPVTPNHN